MRYWLARLLGRADGPRLARCANCRQHFDRATGVQPVGTGLCCSDECAWQASETWAY